MDTIRSPLSSSLVPSIRIHDTDDAPVLFDGSGELFVDVPEFDNYDSAKIAAFDVLGLRGPCTELEDLFQLSHLGTMDQGADLELSPDISPTPSLSSGSSPLSGTLLSLYDPHVFSEFKSLSLPPTTSDQESLWPWSEPPKLDLSSIGSSSSDSGILDPKRRGIHRLVASKAMLEANSRRRWHPTQFKCSDCNQTFTALFSLKRHALTHTGERPFLCGIPGCGQRFYNSSDCKRHEKSKKRHKNLLC